ncbi:MAG: YcxB family protein [Oscillochloris sp.]|nr:YcxB family protein [Oscillochloris sp.]
MQVFNYDVGMDDLVELSLYRLSTNPQVRLQARVLNLVVPLVIFLGSIGTVYLLDADKQLTLLDWIVPSVLGVFMLFLFPRTFTSNLRKRVAAQLNEGPEKSLVGKYTAKIMPELIVQTFKGREVRAAWTAVSQVGSTNQHTFVLIDETQAIIIPRAGFADAQQYDQARALVAQYQRSR